MRLTSAGSGRTRHAASPTQVPDATPKPAAISHSPTYDGCRTHRYGPLVTTAWPGSTSTVVRNAAPRVAIAHTRSASPAPITATPAAWSPAGADELDDAATPIAPPSERAISTRLPRSRSRRPLPCTASRTRRPSSSTIQQTRVMSASGDTALSLARTIACAPGTRTGSWRAADLDVGSVEPRRAHGPVQPALRAVVGAQRALGGLDLRRRVEDPRVPAHRRTGRPAARRVGTVEVLGVAHDARDLPVPRLAAHVHVSVGDAEPHRRADGGAVGTEARDQAVLRPAQPIGVPRDDLALGCRRRPWIAYQAVEAVLQAAEPHRSTAEARDPLLRGEVHRREPADGGKGPAG